MPTRFKGVQRLAEPIPYDPNIDGARSSSARPPSQPYRKRTKVAGSSANPTANAAVATGLGHEAALPHLQRDNASQPDANNAAAAAGFGAAQTNAFRATRPAARFSLGAGLPKPKASAQLRRKRARAFRRLGPGTARPRSRNVATPPTCAGAARRIPQFAAQPYVWNKWSNFFARWARFTRAGCEFASLRFLNSFFSGFGAPK